MFLLDGTWVASATDLVVALRCEYQLLARRAEVAGLIEPVEEGRDVMMARAASLGIDHERAALDREVARHGAGPQGVVVIEQPSVTSRAALEAAHEATVAAIAGGAAVVYQAAFFDGTLHGLADFVVRTPADGRGPLRWEPADTKLARHARAEALLQLAAYAWQLERLGLPAPRDVHLWLGDGSRTHHRDADLRPVLVDRVGRLRQLLDAPVSVPAWGTDDLRWCGWCARCRAAAEARRDVLLVAGVRTDQRATLVDAGLDTIEALGAAAPDAPPEGLRAPVFAKVRAQAALQAAQDASATPEHPEGVVRAEVADPEALALLPPPNPGDVFFDFEGDPLHVDDRWGELGLEYLFGVLTHRDGGPPGATTYFPLWAHDRDAERHALEEFIDWLVARRRTPGLADLHVYHYAPYEVTALKRLVQRYGTRADELDELLKDGVFVDLYGIVRRGVRVSQRSYSIKKLEPLYMGDDERDGEVADGAESVVVYAEFRALVEAGRADEAADRLEALRAYNEYDCLSTLRLRDWLLDRRADPVGGPAPVASPGAAAARDRDDAGAGAPPSPAHVLAEALRAPVVDIPRPERTADQQAVAMVAAALEYHRREVLPFWWEHFRRVGAPVEDWEHDGEMVVLDPDAVEVLDDWHRPARSWTRRYAALVDVPGSFKLVASDRAVFALWDAPLPPEAQRPAGTDRGYAKTTRIERIEPVDGRCRVTVVETLPARIDELAAEHRRFPAALSADAGLEGKAMAASIFAIAQRHVGADGALAPHPGLDLLARRRPRLVGGGPLPDGSGDVGAAIVEAVRRLDRSYLAVQGPPGTGKSTTGARAIAELVRGGWKVGVVAQAHRTVEGFLDKVVEQRIDPALVLKRAAGGGDHRGTPATDTDLLAASSAPVDAGGPGVLIGGTAWDFVSDKRVPAGSLDLLVIDEAGQFSVADALAVSRA
ncbi:MAG TPA: TM0106 family RecB-like putative nuclease, partial [Aquihabitans sp.]|nr:TM0106 family RecB-like putative nuclease [Aquihabitans sp.]